MHISHRQRTLVLLMLLTIVSVGRFALASVLPGKVASPQSELQKAVEKSDAAYRDRQNVRVLRDNKEKAVAEKTKAWMGSAREKRELRLSMARVQRTVALIASRYSVEITSAADARRLIRKRTEESLAIFEDEVPEVCSPADDADRWLDGLLRFLLRWRSDFALLRCARKLPVAELRDYTLAEQAEVRLEQLRREMATAQANANEKQRAEDKAADELDQVEARLEDKERALAAAEELVVRMQAQSEERQREKQRVAMQALVDKGIMTPEQAASSLPADHAGNIRFLWPAKGPISARFLDRKYAKQFGMPHYGEDIAVVERTPVKSAADGVVSIARDGGMMGYSYVLIAHRDGYATVYGHLVEIDVAAGQAVAVGQVIGRSGGRPGVHGSGPMTTAPHLHFEVIHDGENVDPKSVLR